MTDSHWLPARRAAPSPRAPRPRSLYVTMRDGVRLAVDVYDPAGGPAPAIVRQTRYLRRLAAAPGFGWLGLSKAFDLYERTRRVFLDAGYAWVDVDVRGTGASSGAWLHPWSADEVKDGAEIVDWIVKQPWSNGKVGSLGVSYDGTSAEMLLSTRHPAVRAVAPTYALFDVYADVAFPGGIPLAWFTEGWAGYNAELDAGRWSVSGSLTLWLIARAARASGSPSLGERVVGGLAEREAPFRRAVGALFGTVMRGGAGVDGAEPPGAGELAARARNMNVHALAARVVFRDDDHLLDEIPEGTIDSFSPHAQVPETDAAVYSYSGWRDGAYQNAAVRRFREQRAGAARLTLGPWAHTGKLRVRPFATATKPDFDHDAELLAFFDEHLRGRPGDGARVHYFTMVEERWKSADTWPPPGAVGRTLWLGDGGELVGGAPGDASSDERREDGTSRTGERSRWRSLLAVVPGDYPDRAQRTALLLHYDSAPLDADLEVTGHPLARMFLSWEQAGRAHLFVYLDDVAPDGRVAYVTEGELASLHRRAGRPTFRRADAAPDFASGEVVEMPIEMLPISWLFRRGHRIRLGVAGADADHFAVLAPRTFRVHRGAEHASRLVLPVMRRARSARLA